MFKTKISLLLLLIGILAISCKKDNDTKPENLIGNPNGAKKLLAKVTMGNGDVSEFTYDENNRVIKLQESSLLANYTYNKEGKLESATSMDGTIPVRNEFEWSTDGKTLTTLKYVNGLIDTKFIQEINADGEPTKETEFKPDADNWIENGYTVYNWTDGDLMSFEYWSYAKDTQGVTELIKLYYVSYEYDAKINPVRHFTFITTNGNYSMHMASINNRTVSTHYYRDSKTNETTYSYEYDADDYPLGYQSKQTANQQVTVTTVEYTYK